jgi:hypothetical protein
MENDYAWREGLYGNWRLGVGLCKVPSKRTLVMIVERTQRMLAGPVGSNAKSRGGRKFH